MYTKNEILKKELEKKKVLIAAHRGSCGGNICQNNRLSYKAALLQGADMIEIDVIQSTDGVFYAFHNGTEKENLHIDKDIRELSSVEIEKLQMYNWLDESSGIGIERLSDLLDEFEEQCLINIDRSWFYWKEIIDFFVARKNQGSILLKSAPESELLQILQDSGSDIMYMPIVKTKEQWETVKKYNINVAAVEVIFTSLDHPLVSGEMFAEWKELGILTWVNAITLGNEERFNLSAYLDDNRAIAEGFDGSWGQLVRMGFGIIQTDWTGLLKGYLKEIL